MIGATAVGLFSLIHGVEAAACTPALVATAVSIGDRVVYYDGSDCKVIPASKYQPRSTSQHHPNNDPLFI